jgi:hypothetical protein
MLDGQVPIGDDVIEAVFSSRADRKATAAENVTGSANKPP